MAPCLEHSAKVDREAAVNALGVVAANMRAGSSATDGSGGGGSGSGGGDGSDKEAIDTARAYLDARRWLCRATASR
eukprot:NODE_2737_length_884_cov_1349.987937.p7 GENE.NODE_2737_length_884_cov_1349.987937~~NODE_2737_length_884_cov_1349.987937.p7  ORF type:complete len:76 (+),score=28.03 NODE_2737_length_884_cov_1349.987937:62-289(+)